MLQILPPCILLRARMFKVARSVFSFCVSSSRPQPSSSSPERVWTRDTSAKRCKTLGASRDDQKMYSLLTAQNVANTFEIKSELKTSASRAREQLFTSFHNAIEVLRGPLALKTVRGLLRRSPLGAHASPFMALISIESAILAAPSPRGYYPTSILT